jgi:F0F1-type ATP synthase assembly protein I
MDLKKISSRINGSFAIYYGVSALIATVGILIGFFRLLYKYMNGIEPWSIIILTLLLGIAAVFGFVAWLLLRIGYNEFEKKK